MSKMNNPAAMGGPSESKKSHRCLTCCIICLVLMAIFVAIVIGGSAFAFNKFVSPMIGGVKFGSAVKLMSGVYSGERNRKKILTNSYTEEDLSDFYARTLLQLIQVCQSVSSKYTRSKVRKALPKQFAYIIEELLHESPIDDDKEAYFQRIIETIIQTGQARNFSIGMTGLMGSQKSSSEIL